MNIFVTAKWQDRDVIVLDFKAVPHAMAVCLHESSGKILYVPADQLSNCSMLMLGGQPLDFNPEGGEYDGVDEEADQSIPTENGH